MQEVVLTEDVAASGFSVIRGFAVGSSSLEAASRLGEIDVVEGLAPVQKLNSRELYEAPPNTYSGIFGRSEFPLHTDLAHWARPPRYLVLRCVRGVSTVATRVLDGRGIISELGMETLRMAVVQPRRPMRNGMQLLRLLERCDGPPHFLLRWDSVYLRPSSIVGVNACEAVRRFLSRVTPTETTLVHPGDTLIVDNWRCLHGRAAATDGASGRRIERVYLKGLL